jgi:L-rhamnose mutarotase
VERVCFTLHVAPEHHAAYREAHANVWPEMQEALREAGWSNYSLFLRADGLLVGYLETEDFAAAQERMSLTDVNARWQAEMAKLFGARADETWVRVEEVFHLA